MRYDVTKGDFVFVPKGVQHNYQSGIKGGKVLVISSSGLEKYFTEVAGILKTGRKVSIAILKGKGVTKIVSKCGN